MPCRIRADCEVRRRWPLAEFGALVMSARFPGQSLLDTSVACSADDEPSESETWTNDSAECPEPSCLQTVSDDDMRQVTLSLKAFRESLDSSASCAWFVAPGADREKRLYVQVDDSKTVSRKCLSSLGEGVLHVGEVSEDYRGAIKKAKTIPIASFNEGLLAQLSEAIEDPMSFEDEMKLVAKNIAGRNGTLWCGKLNPVRIEDKCLEDHPVYCWKILRIAAFVRRKLDPATDFRVQCERSEDGEIDVTFLFYLEGRERCLGVLPPPMDEHSIVMCCELLRKLPGFWGPEVEVEWNELTEKILSRTEPERPKPSVVASRVMQRSSPRREGTEGTHLETASPGEETQPVTTLNLDFLQSGGWARHPLTGLPACRAEKSDLAEVLTGPCWITEIKPGIYCLDKFVERSVQDEPKMANLVHKPKKLETERSSKIGTWLGLIFGDGKKVEINGYPSNGVEDLLKFLARVSMMKETPATSYRVRCTLRDVHISLLSKEGVVVDEFSVIRREGEIKITADQWEDATRRLEADWQCNPTTNAANATLDTWQKYLEKDNDKYCRKFGLRYLNDSNHSRWGPTTRLCMGNLPESKVFCKVRLTPFGPSGFYIWETDQDQSPKLYKIKAFDHYSNIYLSLYQKDQKVLTVSKHDEFPFWYLRSMMKAFICYKLSGYQCKHLHLYPLVTKEGDRKLSAIFMSNSRFATLRFPFARPGLSGEELSEYWRQNLSGGSGLPKVNESR